MNDSVINEIVALFHGGASVRRIARSLGVSRRTVDKALRQVEQARGGGAAPQPKGARGSRLTHTNR
jgi:transposase-like protein